MEAADLPTPDFSILRDKVNQNLLSLLRNIEGTKSLVFDPSLKELFAYIIGKIDLETFQLDRTFETLTESNVKEVGSRHIIYIIRPGVTPASLIAQQICFCQQHDHFDRRFHIVFVPYTLKSFSDILRLHKVKEETERRCVKVTRLVQGFIAIDHDLLSLEWTNSFAEHLLERDESYLTALNLALAQLEDAYGYIPKRIVKGDKGARVLRALNEHYESEGGVGAGVEREIHGLLVLDRSLDLITPFCLQQTFVGALDECFPLKVNRLDFSTKSKITDHSRLEVPEKVRASQKGREEETKTDDGEVKMNIDLHSEEVIYEMIRDVHFDEIVAKKIFFKMIKEIDTIVNVESKKSQSLIQMEKYVSKLKNMKIHERHPKLTAYINAADFINTLNKHIHHIQHIQAEQNIMLGNTEGLYDFVGSKMVRKLDFVSVMRLLALLSLTEGGVKPKVFYNLRKELLHSYGFEQLVTLLNFQAADLFKEKTGSKGPSWSTLRKVRRLKLQEFKIINEDIMTIDPNDSGYVYSGYTPLFSRLLELLLDKGTRKFSEKLNKYFKGELIQQPRSFQHMLADDEEDQEEHYGKRPKKVLLILIVGGVTFAEVSSLRYVAKQRRGRPAHPLGVKVVVATTQMLNGRKAVAQLTEGPLPATTAFEDK